MKFLKYMSVLLLSVLVFFSNATMAQTDSMQQEAESTQYAIGYEVAFPLCYGLTLTYAIDSSLAIQGLITMSPQPIRLSTLKMLYKLNQDVEPRKNAVYIYALAGQFEGTDVWDFKKQVRGYSVGMGTEFTPKAYPENFKNYLEVGFIHFDSSDYDPSLTLSAGVKVCY